MNYQQLYEQKGENQMSKVTDIENAIIQLGAGEFQEFCDTFLSKKEKYGAIHGLGMKSGTLKTTIGNPDTYFRNENGKYVYVAYTTQQEGIFKKIKEDIEKCFDTTKTKLSIKEIEEIVCCHTSSNLLAGEDAELHKLCEDRGVKLTIFGVDEIAQQIYSKYPTLAKDFFSISVDTNQIMPVDEFIKRYDSNEMAAPLKTVFLGRDEELDSIYNSLSENKVTVIHGKAGVGKTRIVVEAIKKFASCEGFELLCVKNNNLPLYEDLISRTGKPAKYLFFIDDANELAGLSQVIQYTAKSSNGYEVKVIITVRDYAKEGVLRTIRTYTRPHLIQINPFLDENIKMFLDVNLGIKNDIYIDQIIRIAEGNPRIAYMAGKLAKDTQSFSAITDATQVYEQYYENIVSVKISEEKKLCLTTGILSLLNAIVLNGIDKIDSLLELVGISKDEFKDNIYKLAKMEVVEIHLDQVAAISDQCLANYMLYYVFFERKILPFSEVLKVGFIHFKEGVIRALNTLLNIFEKKTLREYLGEEINKVWKQFEEEKSPYFSDFAVVFHVFKPEEAFIIANDKIDNISQEEFSNCKIDFNKDLFKSDDNTLEFFTGYQCSEYLRTVVELLIEYGGKSEEKAIMAYRFLTNTYNITRDSSRFNFQSEKIICETMSQYEGSNTYSLKFILASVKYYLGFIFRSAEVGRGDTFCRYRIELDNSESVKAYRGNCWQIVLKFIELKELQEDIIVFMIHYAVAIRGAHDNSIVSDDKLYVDQVMQELVVSSFKKAIILHDLYYGWKRHKVEHEVEKIIFESPEWKIYSILAKDFFYSDLSYEEYEQKREKDLKDFALALQIFEIDYFVGIAVDVITGLSSISKNSQCYDIIYSIEQIIVFLHEDYDKIKEMFFAIIKYGNQIDVYPGVMIETLLEHNSAEQVYEMLISIPFKNINKWLFYFFEKLPETMVNEKNYNLLLEYLSDKSDNKITSSKSRNMRFLDKYLKIDKDAYVTCSRIIYMKKEYNKFIVEMYFSLLFYEQCYSPEELLLLFDTDKNLLKDVYFFMLENHDMIDLAGSFLAAFLALGEEWVESYTEFVAETICDNRAHDEYRFRTLWNLDDYSIYFDAIFKKLTECKDYLSEWKLSDAFRVMMSNNTDGLQNELANRQEQWILHTVEEYAQSEKVIVLFSAICEVNTELRRKAFNIFLQNNSDYEMFNRLTLDASHWGGYEDEIIPQMQERIRFLEVLLSDLKGTKYIRHAKRVRDQIELWKARIETEELNSICRRLYQ